MALTLQTAHPARGAHWLRDGIRLYLKRPLAFTSLFVLFLFCALFIGLVPLAGGFLQLAMAPLLSLGFMVAGQSALLQGPVSPSQFVEPLRGTPEQRRALLTLCALYGAAMLVVLWLSDLISDGTIAQAVELMRRQAGAREFDALLADRRLSGAVLFGSTLLTLITVPFWHAPALVHWARQGALQALFSSTLAIWRCKGAFLVFGLAWFAMIGVFGVLTTLVLSLLGMAQLVALLTVPAGLFFSTLFYVTLVFTFNDSFAHQA